MTLHEIKKLMKGTSPFRVGQTLVFATVMYERLSATKKGKPFWVVNIGTAHRIFHYEGDAAKFIKETCK